MTDDSRQAGAEIEILREENASLKEILAETILHLEGIQEAATRSKSRAIELSEKFKIFS